MVHPNTERASTFYADANQEELVRIDCHSPFDEAFMAEAVENQRKDIKFLNPKRRELITFQGDCNAPPVFFELFERHLNREVSMGFAPSRCAVFIAMGESGRRYMIDGLKHASRSVPYAMEYFDSADKAESWLMSSSN